MHDSTKSLLSGLDTWVLACGDGVIGGGTVDITSVSTHYNISVGVDDATNRLRDLISDALPPEGSK